LAQAGASHFYSRDGSSTNPLQHLRLNLSIVTCIDHLTHRQRPHFTMEAEAASKAGGRGNATAQDMVRELRAQGLSDTQVRAELAAKGYKKSRISQLINAVPKEVSQPPHQRQQEKRGLKRRHEGR